MNILEVLVQLRDDIKDWVTNNLTALDSKIEEKTIPIDSELSATSTNPVQNKVVSKEIDSLNNLVGDTPVATQISTAIASQEHFSGDYNDLTNAPNISEDGSGNMVIADESGNIIFQADAGGIHTTTVDAKDVTINKQSVTSIMDAKIASLVNSAPETLDTLGELAEVMETNSGAIDALETIAASKAAKSDLDATNADVSALQGLVGDKSVSEQIADHAAKTDIHVSLAEKTEWNNKSDFSGNYNDLDGAPNITEDDSGEVIMPTIVETSYSKQIMVAFILRL